MHRRGFLTITGASLVGGTGCVSSNAPLARLAWINLRNHRTDAYDVDVTVDEDGETLFSETYHLGTEPETANVLVENPVEGQGNYVVTGTLDGETREVETTAFIEGDETCIGVVFELLDNGSVDYATKAMQQC